MRRTHFCLVWGPDAGARRLVGNDPGTSTTKVQELSKNAKSVDLSEPLGLIDEAKRLVNGVKAMMLSAPATQ